MNDGKLNKEEKKAEKAKKREDKLAEKMEEKQVKDKRKYNKKDCSKKLIEMDQISGQLVHAV
ncbi:hypothetical protein ACIQXV_28330 [Neobacillus sp. NPDC097160]|uniref:hypothetical protein n=1 Tax=Neobacillus sp. NPDC097160 TaxID=3364298 RepID=UPI00380EED6F